MSNKDKIRSPIANSALEMLSKITDNVIYVQNNMKI